MPTVPGLDLPHAWTTLDQTGRIIAALVELGLGLILAFFGFRLFRAVLVLTGAALGAYLGLLLTQGTSAPAPLPPGSPDAVAGGLTNAVANGTGTALLGGPLAAWLVPVALALLGAALLWGLYRLGALLFGAALGVGLLGSVGTALAVAPDVQWLLLLAGAIGGALLGWLVQTLVLILATALAGGWATAGAVYLLLHLNDPAAAATVAGWGNGAFAARGTEALIYLLGVLALALLGVAFQARDHARRRARRA